MHRISPSALFLAALVCLSFPYANAGDIAFTPAGIASLQGKDICELKGDFHAKVGVYLDGHKDRAVKYLERADLIVLSFCWVNLCPRLRDCRATLDLTLLVKNGESPEFKCYTETEEGTTWAKWGHIIGLANNQRGRKRFVAPRLAWRVNSPEKQV